MQASASGRKGEIREIKEKAQKNVRIFTNCGRKGKIFLCVYMCRVAKNVEVCYNQKVRTFYLRQLCKNF